MNDDNILGGAMNQLGQTVKKAKEQIVKIPEEMARDAGGQIKPANIQPASNEENKTSENKSKQTWNSDEERIQFLKGLYGPSQPSPEASAGKASQASSKKVNQEKPSEFGEQIKDKTPEEQKKLIELRNQLHKENYYDPTFNPVKKQEERPAEKVENEKKEEMQDLQQKEAKKPQPLAVVKERNKAEMFRGASG